MRDPFDEEFLALIDAADPNFFGVGCPCGTYHVGDIRIGYPGDARCPSCGSKRGWAEAPALSQGLMSVQQEADDGGDAVIAEILFGRRYTIDIFEP